jgi:hypothetical protein
MMKGPPVANEVWAWGTNVTEKMQLTYFDKEMKCGRLSAKMQRGFDKEDYDAVVRG